MVNRRRRPRTKAPSRDDIAKAEHAAHEAEARYARHKAIQHYADALLAALKCARAVVGDNDNDDPNSQLLDHVAEHLEALALKFASARPGKDANLTLRVHIDHLYKMLQWARTEVVRLERAGVARNAKTEAQQILIDRGASTYGAVRAIGGYDDSEPSAGLPSTRPVQLAAQKRAKKRRARIEQLTSERASWAAQLQDRRPLAKDLAAERVVAIDAEISATRTVTTGARSRRKRRTRRE